MALTTLTKDNFFDEVLSSDMPVLVDFWASWCGPCKMLGPIVDELAEELDGSAKVCKVNVDDEPELVDEYEVTSVPTLLLFKNGSIAAAKSGLQSKANLKKMLEL